MMVNEWLDVAPAATLGEGWQLAWAVLPQPLELPLCMPISNDVIVAVLVLVSGLIGTFVPVLRPLADLQGDGPTSI